MDPILELPSPYEGVPSSQWRDTTEKLIAKHPLKTKEIVEVVLHCWNDLFNSTIGSKPLRIWTDICLSPQITGTFLEHLIAFELASRHPKLWRGVLAACDKDLVCLSDVGLSVEIKSSSDPKHIFGNRSYAQKSQSGRKRSSKKTKTGYYIAVNFEKMSHNRPKPKIILIRFGWLDHADWFGQKAETGQQARLSDEVEQGKLLTLYRASE